MWPRGYTLGLFFGVQSGQGQVQALEAAEASSQSALDANKLGYQVGVRINIDVLNAQSQALPDQARTSPRPATTCCWGTLKAAPGGRHTRAWKTCSASTACYPRLKQP